MTNSKLDYLIYNGQLNLEKKEYQKAESYFNTALKLSVDSIIALTGLAESLYAQLRFHECSQVLNRCIQLEPQNSEFYYLQGKNFMKMGLYELAITQFHSIRFNGHQFEDLRARYFFCLSQLKFLPPVNLYDTLCDFIQQESTVDQNMAHIVAEQIKQRYIKCGVANNNLAILRNLSNDRLFELYLQNFFNVDQVLEGSIKSLRQELLRLPIKKIIQNESNYKLALNLATQAYNNAYIMGMSTQERIIFRELQALWPTIEHGSSMQTGLTVVLAMYSPLDFQQLEAFLTLPTRLPEENLLINRLKRYNQLKSSNTAGGGPLKPENITQAVRAQYEEYPFPIWNAINLPNRKQTFSEYIKHQNENISAPIPPNDIDILVAGCGTGKHVLTVATQYHYRSIAAIDLSLTSLSYAQSKIHDSEHPNITYYQADISTLIHWEKRFYLIESIGVIHHTPKPIDAWRNLTTLLHPNGWMKIGLYSRQARRFIQHAKNIIEEKGIEATMDGMRAFREHVLRSIDDEYLLRLLNYSDFYNSNHLRDMLFHVCEHTYDISDLKRLLDSLGLSFMGFYFGQNNVLKAYRKDYPSDPSGQNLDNWAEFEEKYPDTFIGMYQMWCVKKHHISQP